MKKRVFVTLYLLVIAGCCTAQKTLPAVKLPPRCNKADVGWLQLLFHALSIYIKI